MLYNECLVRTTATSYPTWVNFRSQLVVKQMIGLHIFSKYVAYIPLFCQLSYYVIDEFLIHDLSSHMRKLILQYSSLTVVDLPSNAACLSPCIVSRTSNFKNNKFVYIFFGMNF